MQRTHQRSNAVWGASFAGLVFSGFLDRQDLRECSIRLILYVLIFRSRRVKTWFPASVQKIRPRAKKTGPRAKNWSPSELVPERKKLKRLLAKTYQAVSDFVSLGTLLGRKNVPPEKATPTNKGLSKFTKAPRGLEKLAQGPRGRGEPPEK